MVSDAAWWTEVNKGAANELNFELNEKWNETTEMLKWLNKDQKKKAIGNEKNCNIVKWKKDEQKNNEFILK
jgi:hypothetical protein